MTFPNHGPDLRIGIIGCGGIAGVHRRAIEQIPGLKITTVYDQHRPTAESFAAQCDAAVADALDAMADPEVLDAVVLCTPPAGRATLCLPFIQAGIPVLCEKPMEISSEAAHRLTQAVEQSGSVFMLGFCHRFHGPIVELRRRIDAGTLGKPLLMRNIFAGYFDLTHNHRANPAVAGGGCLIDNGTHAIDLFRHLVGEPTAVQALGGHAMQDVAVEDLAMMQLAADNHAYGEITNSFSLKVAGNWVEWYGTEGTAIVSYGNPGQPDLSYRRADETEWTPVDCSAHPPRFVGQWQRFIAAVRGDAAPWPTVHDGCRACDIIEAGYTAMRTGQRQSIAAPAPA